MTKLEIGSGPADFVAQRIVDDPPALHVASLLKGRAQNLNSLARSSPMARTQFALTFSALLIAVGSCFGAVNLPVGQSAYIVASPKSQLEKRTVDQLTNYLTAVLHKEARVVSDLRFVPSSTSAIMLARTGEVNPLGASAPAGAPEGFALVSGKSEEHFEEMSLTDLKKEAEACTKFLKSEPSGKLYKSFWFKGRRFTIKLTQDEVTAGEGGGGRLF